MNSLSEKNWLIVGLGNLGERYEKTRHNLGFMLIDRMARELNAQVRRAECRALVGQGEIDGRRVELVKPQTYMNLSGEAVSCLVKKDNRSVEKLIVISDDLALPFGRIRLRSKGSAGGQKGLQSIIDCLRTQDFIRLRIGIQPEHPIGDASRFVLDDFSRTDCEKVEKILERSAEAIRCVLRDGIEKAMAEFN